MDTKEIRGAKLEVVHEYPLSDMFLPEKKFLLKKKNFRTFASKGARCVSCGEVGKYLIRVRPSQGKRCFWGVCTKDYELLTVDHIVPKSLGGANSKENYQTMCLQCNTYKSNGRVTIRSTTFVKVVQGAPEDCYPSEVVGKEVYRRKKNKNKKYRFEPLGVAKAIVPNPNYNGELSVVVEGNDRSFYDLKCIYVKDCSQTEQTG